MNDLLPVGGRILVLANIVLGTPEVWGTVLAVYPTYYEVALDGDEPGWSGPVSFAGEVLSW